MVPAAVVVLDAFPLTPNNKIDRAALPAPVFTSVAGRAPATAARRPSAGWRRRSCTSTPSSIDDNFFDLGGDSILSIQLVSRARRQGVDITPRQVFEAPTFAALAALAGTSRRRRSVEAPADRVGPIPATPMVAWLRHVAEVQGGRIERIQPVGDLLGARPAPRSTPSSVSCRPCSTGTRCSGPASSGTPEAWTLDIRAAPVPRCRSFSDRERRPAMTAAC